MGVIFNPRVTSYCFVTIIRLSYHKKYVIVLYIGVTPWLLHKFIYLKNDPLGFF